MTPQAARIDAHALNESGTTRLCYCGSVLRAMPTNGDSSRSPVQLGAEIFGNTDISADIEIVRLALDTVRLFTDEPLMIDVGHAGTLRSILGSHLKLSRIRYSTLLHEKILTRCLSLRGRCLR